MGSTRTIDNRDRLGKFTEKTHALGEGVDMGGACPHCGGMCTGSSCSAAETLEALNAIPEPTDDELGEMYAAELADGLADHPRAAAALSELAVTGPSPSGSRRDADGSTALIVADPAHADGLAVSRSGVVTDAATSKPVETSWTPAQERAVAHAVREVQTVPRAKLVEVLG